MKNKQTSKSTKKKKDKTKTPKLDVLESNSKQNNPSLPFWTSPYFVPVVLVFIGLIGLGFLFKDWFVVAFVNGQPITRYELINTLETANGKQALERLITDRLITQEAAKQQVQVSTEEIDAEIKTIESQVSEQGQDLSTVLTQQGMTKADLVEQLKMQLLVKKLQSDPEEITEEDVAEMLEQQADFFPEEMTDEEKEQAVREQLEQQRANNSIQAWLEELENKANITYWKQY